MIKRIILSVLLIMGSSLATAMAQPELILNTIKTLQPNESSSDELYFTVTAFYSSGEYDTYTIPGGKRPALGHYGVRFPAGPPRQPMLYWTANALPKINNISLWKGQLKPGESVQLVVSLVEHDVPPWNLDDLIGSIKVRLGNTKGKLSANYTLVTAQATRDAGTMRLGRALPVMLGNGEGQYQVKLTLKP